MYRRPRWPHLLLATNKGNEGGDLYSTVVTHLTVCHRRFVVRHGLKKHRIVPKRRWHIVRGFS